MSVKKETKDEQTERAGRGEESKAPEIEKVEEMKAENQFTKEQLLASKRFRDRRDLVAALLTDGEQYTVRAVEQKIDNYMKGQVK